jgi:hypothetical protein
MKTGSRSGLTVIELCVTLTLLALVTVKGVMILRMTNRSQASETADMDLEDSARRLLDRIAYAIMGSTRDRLFPDPESPIFSDSVEYVVSLGVEDGEVVWSDPDRISLDDAGKRVSCLEAVDTTHERETTWTNVARPFLEGELPNGIDDNGNGLVDERGLTFTLDGNSVHIELSMERPGLEGTMITKSVRRSVTIRN